MFRSIYQFLKKVLWVVWLIVALVFGACFASENEIKIAPLLLGYSLPSLSVGVYLAAMLFVGIFIGSALSFFASWRRISSLNKQIQDARHQEHKRDMKTLKQDAN